MGSFRNILPVTVRTEVYFYGCFLLLMLPLRWLLAWLAAAAFHELCHYLAVVLCGGHVNRILLGIHGAVMEVTPISPAKECICALAGPAGGLLLLVFARWIPLTAVCAFLQSVYNLLPVFPLDGGRAVRCFIKRWLPNAFGVRLGQWVEWIALTLPILAGLYAAMVLNLGIIPLFAAAVLLIKYFLQRERETSTIGLPVKKR